MRSRRAAALGMGLVLALLLAEGVARWVEARDPVGRFAGHLDADTAGCASASLTRIYEIVGRCGRDDDGFLLDKGRPLGDPAARRVMVIGDSVGEQSWTLHLADRLRARGLGPVEVWNASVGGYGTCQEAAAAEELVGLARPDVVVVETCPNDVFGSPVVLAGHDGFASAVVDGERRRFPRVLLASALFRRGLGRATGAAKAQTTVEAARECARRLVRVVGSIPLVVVHFPALVDDPRHPLLAEERDVEAAWADAPGIRLRERLGRVAELRESPTDLFHPREGVQHRIAASFVDDVAAAMGARR